ncbi:AMIN-like domain-containing (lipo)protein [Georgenia alba]|uniref:AMIN-like domain-containing protein n=1 Tax=Georgenia alba TaxID=2233858 RepID=A0ABW2QDH9_9MICO
MKRLLGVVVMLLLGLTLVSPTATAAPAAPYCGLTWGSLRENVPRYSEATVQDVRSGRHDCFDRMVVDLRGDVRGYDVRYVSVVRADGSGAAVPLRGGARLAVVVRAPAYDQSGDPTYQPADPRELTNVAGYRTFRQIAWAGSFEGQTTIGLGVRARLPFRVLILDGPGTGSRLVVDVAHRW